MLEQPAGRWDDPSMWWPYGLPEMEPWECKLTPCASFTRLGHRAEALDYRHAG
jgi:hypothetical protein